jgi:branched-chain amino acid transport system substrate-binding protein
MNNPKIIAWVLAILAVVGLVWWSAARDTEPAAGETVKIGAALGLSGQCAEFGEGERDAINLAAEEINDSGGIGGRSLKVIIEDTHCENRTTVSAIQKLINVDDVRALVGPTWGDSFQAAYPIINAQQIVSVSPSAALEALEFQGVPVDYVFSTWIPQRSEIDALQKYAASHNIGNFVVVHD